MHRGYSWPGLYKVSQVLGDGEGDKVKGEVDELRRVRDCKVSQYLPMIVNNNET